MDFVDGDASRGREKYPNREAKEFLRER